MSFLLTGTSSPGPVYSQTSKWMSSLGLKSAIRKERVFIVMVIVLISLPGEADPLLLGMVIVNIFL